MRMKNLIIFTCFTHKLCKIYTFIKLKISNGTHLPLRRWGKCARVVFSGENKNFSTWNTVFVRKNSKFHLIILRNSPNYWRTSHMSGNSKVSSRWDVVFFRKNSKFYLFFLKEIYLFISEKVNIISESKALPLFDIHVARQRCWILHYCADELSMRLDSELEVEHPLALVTLAECTIPVSLPVSPGAAPDFASCRDWPDDVACVDTAMPLTTLSASVWLRSVVVSSCISPLEILKDKSHSSRLGVAVFHLLAMWYFIRFY